MVIPWHVSPQHYKSLFLDFLFYRTKESHNLSPSSRGKPCVATGYHDLPPYSLVATFIWILLSSFFAFVSCSNEQQFVIASCDGGPLPSVEYHSGLLLNNVTKVNSVFLPLLLGVLSTSCEKQPPSILTELCLINVVLPYILLHVCWTYSCCVVYFTYCIINQCFWEGKRWQCVVAALQRFLWLFRDVETVCWWNFVQCHSLHICTKAVSKVPI